MAAVCFEIRAEDSEVAGVLWAAVGFRGAGLMDRSFVFRACMEGLFQRVLHWFNFFLNNGFNLNMPICIHGKEVP